jgi:hypothetical protein
MNAGPPPPPAITACVKKRQMSRLATLRRIHTSVTKSFHCYISVSCVQRGDILTLFIQSVPGGKDSILGGHSIVHSKKSLYTLCSCGLFRVVSEIRLFHCTVHCTLYRRATRHVLARVAKGINAAGGIFENVLY